MPEGFVIGVACADAATLRVLTVGYAPAVWDPRA